MKRIIVIFVILLLDGYNSYAQQRAPRCTQIVNGRPQVVACGSVKGVVKTVETEDPKSKRERKIIRETPGNGNSHGVWVVDGAKSDGLRPATERPASIMTQSRIDATLIPEQGFRSRGEFASSKFEVPAILAPHFRELDRKGYRNKSDRAYVNSDKAAGEFATPQQTFSMVSQAVAISFGIKDSSGQLVAVPPNQLGGVMTTETVGNCGAVPRRKDGSLASSAKGCFQILDGTWSNKVRKYGNMAVRARFVNSVEELNRRNLWHGAFMAACYLTEIADSIQERYGYMRLTWPEAYQLASLGYHSGEGNVFKALDKVRDRRYKITVAQFIELPSGPEFENFRALVGARGKGTSFHLPGNDGIEYIKQVLYHSLYWQNFF